MFYKKIALFFLLLFCSDQMLAMQTNVDLSETTNNSIPMLIGQGTGTILACIIAVQLMAISAALIGAYLGKVTRYTTDTIARKIRLYKLRKADTDPNIPWVGTNTLLHEACAAEDVPVVEFLLNHPHIDPNKKTDWGIPPLYRACEKLNRTIIQLFLMNPTTDPNFSNSKGSLLNLVWKHYGKNPIETMETLKLFINNPRTDINQLCLGFSNLLSWACYTKSLDIVSALLERDDLQINTKALCHAYNDNTLFSLLCTSPKTNLADIFSVAIEKQDKDLVKELLEKYDFNNLDPRQFSLHRAALTGNLHIFKCILNKNVIDINSVNGANPEAYNGTVLHFAIMGNNPDIVQLLLQENSIHVTNEINHECLHLAIENIHEAKGSHDKEDNATNIILLLCNHIPALVNSRNNKHETSLIRTAREHSPYSMDTKVKIINFLIDICKADISLKNSHNKTFFYYLFKSDYYFDLNKLTFFKNYERHQQKAFLTEQLTSMAQSIFSDKKKYNYNYVAQIDRILTSFFLNCKNYGADFTQRNKTGDLPLDIAYKRHTILAKYAHPQSIQFHITEKIYTTFLKETKDIFHEELYYHLSRNGLYPDILPHTQEIKEKPYHRLTWTLSEASKTVLHRDVLRHIMRYYCSLEARDIINKERKQLGLLAPAQAIN